MDLENLRYKYFLTEIFVLGQKAAGVRGFNNIQDYYTIQKECLDSGKLFEDPEFPLTGNWKWLRPHEICKNLGAGKPQFFVDSVSRFDVKQGRLGDCWFLAAMAALTARPSKFNRIVCKDNSFDNNYAGIFHFRFWIHGKWVEVIVDDRLPVNDYGQLNCLHSKEPNEFWSALLEKAYAKIFGGYDALTGGNASDAFEDFTGGFSEEFELAKAPKNLHKIMQQAVKRGSLMACSLKPDPNTKEAVGSNGLVQGHAYSVTGAATAAFDASGEHFEYDLVRLRNPWGHGEWKGGWNDSSTNWFLLSKAERERLGFAEAEDGEFWMSFYDFTKLFKKLELCNTSAQSLDEDSRNGYFWDTTMYTGSWVKGKSAGGCGMYPETYHTNPQYVVTLETNDVTYNQGLCNVMVSLMQKYGRHTSGTANLFIGFDIYQLKEHHLNQVPLSKDFLKYSKVVGESIVRNSRGITARFKLPPGHYLIVPSTFKPDQETEFLLRISFEKERSDDSKLIAFKEANKHKENSGDLVEGDTFKPCQAEDIHSCNVALVDPSNKSLSQDQIAEQLFKEVAGTNDEIDWMELKTILDQSIPQESREKANYSDYKNDGFSRDICRSIIAMMDTDYSRKLKLDEFKKFYATFAKWMDAFQKFNESGNWRLNPQELVDALKSIQFDISVKVVNLMVYRYGSPYNTLLFEDFIMCAVKLTSMSNLFKEKAGDMKNDATFNLDDFLATTLYS